MPGALTLIVPGDEADGGGLVALLGQTSHRVRFACDADAALETLSRQPFDLVLLDTSVPGCDGAQILQDLKCDSRVWHIPVIVVGSPDNAEDIVRCLDLGAEDYVLQPLHPTLVTLRINALLAKRRLQELETEYIKIFEEQSAELNELKREARR
ncbi:MAG: hypothetical protein QOJ23_2683 [Actinomycetota bacterium]|jgi:two-component system response regulator|nr:hypothetical protein [Actinomycetota bacterium]